MNISQQLEAYTASISNFQPMRNYVSMSHAVEDAETLIRQYKEGYPDTLDIRLKCYKGYQWERDLMERMSQAFRTQVSIPLLPSEDKDFELSAFSGLVRGHLDGKFEGYPLECKTVPLDEHLPQEGKVSKRIYWQLQSYMLYGHWPKALVIYESRETGHLRDWWIRENKAIQSAIYSKHCTVAAALGVSPVAVANL